MGQLCKVCQHSYKFQIETEIAKGTSSRKIGTQFGVSYKSVQRHAKLCKSASQDDPSQSVPSGKVPKGTQSPAEEIQDFIAETKEELLETESGSSNDAYPENKPIDYSISQAALNWPLEKHLAYARQIIFNVLHNYDPKTRMAAVAAYHKNIELEAKRTGQFVNPQDNPQSAAAHKAAAEAVIEKIIERENIDREAAIERFVKLKPEVAKWLN